MQNIFVDFNIRENEMMKSSYRKANQLLVNTRKIIDELIGEEEITITNWTNDFAKQIPVLEKNCKEITKQLTDEIFAQKHSNITDVLDKLAIFEEKVIEYNENSKN